MDGFGFYEFKEFAVVARAVGTKVLEYFSERGVGHGDLEEVVAEGNL